MSLHWQLVANRSSCSRLRGVALALCAVLASACGQAPAARSCIVELAGPRYPEIALNARLTLSGIKALVHLRDGRGERVEQVYLEGARLKPMFESVIEDAVARSRFDPTCGICVETLHYDFVDVNPGYRDPPDRDRVSFVPPNRIIVASTGASVQFSSSTP